MSKALSKVSKLKGIIGLDSVKEQFRNSMKENSGAFVSSLIELYSSDTYLQNCEPTAVVQEALKAASLNLPINKNLGFAWIIPRKEKGVMKPNFQIGYKGYVQLAMRTGKYRTINANVLPEGYEVIENLLTGEIKFEGKKKSNKAIGFFAYFELLNGFSKTIYMSLEEMTEYSKAYAKGLTSKYSPWNVHFESMGKKTVLSILLRTYGILSTEMITAFGNEKTPQSVESEIEENANSLEFDKLNPKDEIIPDEDDMSAFEEVSIEN